MLTPFDDYPIHQTPAPIAEVGSGHPDMQERYTFSGFDAAGALFFAATIGIFPNRGVMDASLSVLADGIQRSVNASGRLTPERNGLAVGPFRLEVIEPLRSLRFVVGTVDLGIEADMIFTATAAAVAEPRICSHEASVLVDDFTRMIQWGTWQGNLSVDGAPHRLSPESHLGIRERTWGIRQTDSGSRVTPSHTLPQTFQVRISAQCDDQVINLAIDEDSDGRRAYESSLSLTADGTPTKLGSLHHHITWKPGTRWIEHATFDVEADDGGVHHLELQPLVTFAMRGIGYTDPQWAHGSWKGELVLGTRSWVFADLEPTDFRNIHVQHVFDTQWVRPDGSRHNGVGLVDQLVVNDHHPSGLTGFLDGFDNATARR